MNIKQNIPIGISACLLGDNVRHNGGHKLSTYCRDVLGPWFDYRPVCPEMSIGLGTPRPTIRLVSIEGRNQAIQTSDKNGSPEQDVTEALARVAENYHQQQPALCGYIFMEKSPSCGVWRVKRYNDAGNALPSDGRGIFADRLMTLRPDMPVEEAGRLNDPDLRESFIVRVFASYDWQTQVLPALDLHNLIRFWTRYKYLVLAHDEKIYRQIGPLLAKADKTRLVPLATEFFRLLLQALATPSKRSGNVNALEHLRGFIKEHADPVEKASMTRSINDYRKGIVPLIVPLSLLRHLLDRYPVDYARIQQFLQPYPDELSLRNNK
jgi:uncharacterized protein YbgA (DUF1722 family)/uncharacterized protein YbbK (DUF523 family)